MASGETMCGYACGAGGFEWTCRLWGVQTHFPPARYRSLSNRREDEDRSRAEGRKFQERKKKRLVEGGGRGGGCNRGRDGRQRYTHENKKEAGRDTTTE